ncbi:hypothetical protein [Ralstonia sp. SET104]|uniref:hypothetical protein n=1 Tax=Ralstonia sp. SET104 TaxID=2448774 RepID=UPI000F58A8CB|nr:hypothetical protein [Ralstonia sp. SET104]GCB04732.1 hypothetical protein PSUB009319_23630 [Ralstonia sp. SET104]
MHRALRTVFLTTALLCQSAAVLLFVQRPALAESSPPAPTAGTTQAKALTKDKYRDEVTALKQVEEQQREEGKSEEEIARNVDQKRRELNQRYYSTLPDAERKALYASNKKKYGNEIGPDIDYFKKKGRSWREISDSASKVSSKI